MDWQDIENVLFDGSQKDILALRCPSCDGKLNYSYCEVGRTLVFGCSSCGHIERDTGCHTIPNCSRVAANSISKTGTKAPCKCKVLLHCALVAPHTGRGAKSYAAGDEELLEQQAVKIMRAQTELKMFLNRTGLTNSLYRTQVLGYNRRVASSFMQSVKRQERFQHFVKDFRILSPTKKQSAGAIEYIRSIREKGASLSTTDQRILEQIIKRFTWVQVKPEEANIYTLAALTAKTDDEFAMFAKGDLKYTWRE